MPYAHYRVPSVSMEPTIPQGTVLWVTEFDDSADVMTHVQRGDVVSYLEPRDGKVMLKRVVGMPGDTIAMRDGTVILGGRLLQEAYVQLDPAPVVQTRVSEMDWMRPHRPDTSSRDTIATMRTWGPIIVPPRQYFMLGDFRDNSYDSRLHGFVLARNVTGYVKKAALAAVARRS